MRILAAGVCGAAVLAAAASAAAQTSSTAAAKPKAGVPEMLTVQNQEDAPHCNMCGTIMVRSGSCYKCINCGSTSGCA